MLHDPILHLLGLARKAGRLEAGEEPVGAACRAKQAKLILLASDAASNSCRRAAHFGQTGAILQLSLPFTKAELGGMLGRSSCAMLALTDAGFSASVIERLAKRDPERYGPAATQLRAKADRVLQRQKEQRQHEKNLRDGKHKPWATPAKQPAGKPPAKAPAARQPGERGKPPAKNPAARQPGGTGKPPAKNLVARQPSKAGTQTSRPKSSRPGGSAPRTKAGPTRAGQAPAPGPGGRRLSGKFRHNP